MVYQYNPSWQCTDCTTSGPAGDQGENIPRTCPKCGSKNISKPLIKHNGPFKGQDKKEY
ncbi:MAG: hypothetical protein Q7K65_00070 [Candidatus Buchananbacteria bacterium]|nr:hypothetical protein [Candidatus Buchananbacteria bacterium]